MLDKQNRWKWIRWVLFLLGILIILTPYQLAPVCTDFLELKSGKLVYMKCQYSARAVILLGGMLILNSLLFFTKTKGKKTMGISIAIIGLAIILIPQQWVIGVCLNETMSCRTTLIWFCVEGFLVILLGLGIAFNGRDV